MPVSKGNARSSTVKTKKTVVRKPTTASHVYKEKASLRKTFPPRLCNAEMQRPCVASPPSVVASHNLDHVTTQMQHLNHASAYSAPSAPGPEASALYNHRLPTSTPTLSPQHPAHPQSSSNQDSHQTFPPGGASHFPLSTVPSSSAYSMPGNKQAAPHNWTAPAGPQTTHQANVLSQLDHYKSLIRDSDLLQCVAAHLAQLQHSEGPAQNQAAAYTAESGGETERPLTESDDASGDEDEREISCQTSFANQKTSPKKTEKKIKTVKYLLGEIKSLVADQGDREAMRLVAELEHSLSLLPGSTNVHAEIALALQPLRSENAQLRRRLRILNQQFRDRERAVRTDEQNSEVAALQSMNETLQHQLNESQKGLETLQSQNQDLLKALEIQEEESRRAARLIQEREEEILHLKQQKDLTSANGKKEVDDAVDYWAVFSEYVKTMLRNGYAPIEFFIEGQRSRTGKTIHPRLGLLNVVTEPFFRGEVYDTYVVPISISYEKILEETFHVQELLGAQKSKESTSGLIKARKILRNNFGNIHIYIGQPISLRSMVSGKVNRMQCNLTHRHNLQRPSEDIQKFISDMAYKIELHQIANTVLSPGDLVAVILLMNLPVLSHNLLIEKILWLKKLIEDFGGSLDWPDNKTIDEVVQSSVSLHSNFMAIVDSQIVLLEHNVTDVLTEDLVTKQTVTFLTCATYRNKMVNVFIRPALVVLACKTAQSLQKDDIYRSFCFLRNLLSKEFILFPDDEGQDFEEGCLLLAKFNIINRTPCELFLNENDSVAQFLYRMLYSFLQGYQMACTYIKENIAEHFTDKQYIAGVRNYAFKYILTGVTKCYDALSSDLLKNTLASFVQLGIITATKTSSGTYFSPDAKEVIQATATLEVHSRKFPASRL